MKGKGPASIGLQCCMPCVIKRIECRHTLVDRPALVDLKAVVKSVSNGALVCSLSIATGALTWCRIFYIVR